MARHRLCDFNYMPEDKREPDEVVYGTNDLDEEETAWAYEDEDPEWWDYYDGDDELDENGRHWWEK